MKYNGPLQPTEIETCNLDYIKGFLHSFSILNEPNSTLGYSYDIIELRNDGDNLIESLKTFSFVFKNQPIVLNVISETTFKAFLEKWFFHEGELRNHSSDEYKKDRIVEFYYQAIKDITKVDNINKVENLSMDYEETYLDLGVSHDYFVLLGQDRTFLLYFRFDD
jgi:hypothetical protein